MKRLTTQQLEAIRKRAEAATEGKWAYALLSHEHRTYTLGAFNGGVTGVGDINREADADFIAHAREDIPALIAEVERLSGIDEIYDEDVGELERQNAGLTEQSEMFYEKYRKERRDRARSESKLKEENERLREIVRRLDAEVVGIAYATTDVQLFKVVGKVAEIIHGGVGE